MIALFKRFSVGWKLFSLLFLTLAAFSYAMFQGGFVSWFLFYSFLPFAIYSILLMLYPIRSFQVTRKVNQEQFTAGQRLIATVTVKRKFPFPLFYLLVEDELTDRIKGIKKLEEPKKLFFPWFKRSVTYSYALLNMPRGEHQFGSVRVRTGDLFGLIEKEMTFVVENYFLVYPTLIDVDYRPNEKQFEQGSASTQTKYWQDSTIAVGVREYQPGDKFAWIDWKATARRDSIMTKEFEQLQSRDVVVFLDRTKSALFESLITHTASYIKAIVKSGARVSLISMGSDQHVFGLQSDEQHVRSIFYHLAKVDCDSHKPFSASLENPRLKADMKQVTNIIFTSNLNLDLVRKLEGLVGHQQTYMVYMVKGYYDKLSKEDSVLIERLKKRHISVRILQNRDVENGFKEVGNS
ncbi:uncharacterized protein (DUF58 family) [Metabacillus crassostreae]|uniref:DUF58 domain-containing protein n=1 Tax=Metabacillus crassostreae TaxID=929098 RepID=UPI001956A7D2|nr:DUF58 domain-containing protein [Metabacillus crassostreae]MBM7606598.1 uncharacterized protein (DUF58 family) [Metabacillus crassostreae]